MLIRKKITVWIAFFALVLLSLGVCLFGIEARDASALTYTTPKYLTNGRTTTGTSVSTGCPSNFKIYMSNTTNGSTGTLSQGAVLDWSYF